MAEIHGEVRMKGAYLCVCVSDGDDSSKIVPREFNTHVDA